MEGVRDEQYEDSVACWLEDGVIAGLKTGWGWNGSEAREAGKSRSWQWPPH